MHDMENEKETEESENEGRRESWVRWLCAALPRGGKKNNKK